jgi:hypothetical protein
MADAEDPIVIDAREGIPAEALDQLRKATRIVIGIKDARTAVLGYWRPESADADVDEDRMGVVVLTRYGPGPAPMAGSVRVQTAHWRQSDVWPLTIDAQQDERWGRILAMLQPGDLVRVESTRSGFQRMPGLDIRNGSFSAFVPLADPEFARRPRSVRAI